MAVGCRFDPCLSALDASLPQRRIIQKEMVKRAVDQQLIPIFYV